MARHTEGQVTSVNPDKGQLYVKTTEGRMPLHFPTSALQSVRKGDSVTIELAMKDNGPALKMKLLGQKWPLGSSLRQGPRPRGAARTEADRSVEV